MTTTALLAQQADTTAAPAFSLEQLGWGPVLEAALLVVIGVPAVYFAARLTRRVVAEQLSPQEGLIAGKLVLYPGLLIIAVSAMMELGFSLAPLLGAAGVLGIALGFAAQTSVSNVISGLFLMGERPFVVDDIIRIGTTTGYVLSIDTLSVKLRTFDNTFVRIPNESIIKGEVTNLTRFPIRRFDIHVGVAYREDVERVRQVLFDVADGDPTVLMEPEPKVYFDGFGDSSINLRLSVWAQKDDFIDFRYGIQEKIKRRFDEEGIEIPFPHRTLYAGSRTGSFPVAVTDELSSAGEPS